MIRVKFPKVGTFENNSTIDHWDLAHRSDEYEK